MRKVREAVGADRKPLAQSWVAWWSPPPLPHPVTFSPGSQQSLRWLSLAAAPASLSGYSQGEGSRSDSASPLSGTLQRLLVLSLNSVNVVQRSCTFWSLPTPLTFWAPHLLPSAESLPVPWRAPSLVPPDLGTCSPLSLTLAPYLSLPLPLLPINASLSDLVTSYPRLYQFQYDFPDLPKIMPGPFPQVPCPPRQSSLNHSNYHKAV